MCDKPKVQLYLYLDGELDAPEADAFEAHLHTCSSCQEEAEKHHRLQSLLQTAMPNTDEEVPPDLVASIRRQLPRRSLSTLFTLRWPERRRAAWAGGFALAAVVLLAVVLRGGFAPSVAPIVQEIVDSQLRARLMQTPYKAVSVDSDAIRQWFHGQVEFAPPLPAISQTQYKFLGVRLNYFLNRRVAEIGYASRTHVLSFLMFPDKDLSLQTLRQVQAGARTFYVQSYKGYNTVLWEDGAVFCSLVSDLRMDELLRVARQAVGLNPSL
jgi:anti-sigma factor (TIGR02949 family)